MDLSWMSLSQLAVSCFSSAKKRKVRQKQKLRNSCSRGNRRFEQLEERTVFSATFGSALAIGNGAETSAIYDVEADSAGNSYISGLFRGTVDFDLANVRADGSDLVTARGSIDAFVAKYGPDDSLIWVRAMGGDSMSGNNNDVAKEIAIDASGAVYVTGEFSDSAVFGATTLVSMGEADGFITKLDAAGNFQWAMRWGNTAWDHGRGIDVDAAGNVYVLGARSNGDYEIMKFGPTGGSAWTKSIATHSLLAAADLAVNAAGQVFVAGSFEGTVDFDPSIKTKNVSSGNGQGAFVLKLDTTGRYDWVSPFLGKSGSISNVAGGMSIAFDATGNVIVGGYFRGTVDFNPGSGTTFLSCDKGGYITKLNTAGGLVWAKPLLADAVTYVTGLDTDAAGNIYATGWYFGTVDLDPGIAVRSRTAAGGTDIYALKLSSAGNLVWAETFGSTSNAESSNGIAVGLNGDVFMGGHYRDPFDINPDPTVTEQLPSGNASRGYRMRLRQM